MLSDSIRNHAFESALGSVCKGKLVADVGAGSGILSLMAARAGAEHVFGIEFSDFIAEAKENVRVNLMD